MNTQTQLSFMAPMHPDRDVQRFLAYLAEKGSWVTRRQIQQDLGCSERAPRLWAAKARRLVVSGPGTPGYKLMALATVDEIRRAAEKMMSQGRDMQEEGLAMLKEAHLRLNGKRSEPEFQAPCTATAEEPKE